MIDRRGNQSGKMLVYLHAVTIPVDHPPRGREPVAALATLGVFLMVVMEERKVGFTKNTAKRHRRFGGRAVTVTARLHRQR